MGITVRKAGDILAKAAAASGVGPKIPLRQPRAVTAAEAPMIQPARESTKVTMMPWRGWFDRLLKENMSESLYKKYRYTFFFWPDDIYDLQPIMPAKAINPVDPKHARMYRYPSPGSQPAPSLPEFDLDWNEDPYDNGYFKRATNRRYSRSDGNLPLEKMKLELMDQNDPNVQEGECTVCLFICLLIYFCVVYIN